MPTFTVFRPPTSLGVMVGAGVAAVSLLLGLALLYKGISMDVRLLQAAPLVLGAFFLIMAAVYGYWTWGCSSLSYVVDRNALSIRWGGLRQVIPLDNIQRLVGGQEEENPQIDGVNWPGHHVGISYAAGVGDVIFYSTHRTPLELLYVFTPACIYAISVPDQQAFAMAVQENRDRGPLFEQRQAVHRWGFSAQTFWLDSNARLLGVLLIGAFLAVLGYVLGTFPDLSQQVPLRFPALGGIVRVTDKTELLDIPRSGAGFLALNLGLAIVLHSWDRMVAYVLLLAGIAIQLMLLVAAIVAVA